MWGHGGAQSGWFGDYEALGFNGRWDNSGYNWGFQANLNLYTYDSPQKSSNSADVVTAPGIGHSAIEGQYNGNNFAITVRTRANSMFEVFASLGPADNQCGIGGDRVALRGANIRALYQYSRMLNWMESKGVLRYNALTANCAFYTFLGMNLAGVNNAFIPILGAFPAVQGFQMKATQGWGY